MDTDTARWHGQTPYGQSEPLYMARFERNPTDDEVTRLRERFAEYAESLVITFYPAGASRDSQAIRWVRSDCFLSTRLPGCGDTSLVHRAVIVIEVI